MHRDEETDRRGAWESSLNFLIRHENVRLAKTACTRGLLLFSAQKSVVFSVDRLLPGLRRIFAPDGDALCRKTYLPVRLVAPP